MIQKVYSIKDVKIDYGTPFVQTNEHVAVRSFTSLVNDERSQTSQIYEDLELWQIANFNTVTGEITPELKYICKGIDVYKGGKNENSRT